MGRSRSRSRERHKKEKKRNQESRSSPSFDQKLEKLRREKEKQKSLEKKRMKEIETPEQKRERRLAKRLQKEERRRALIQNVLPESIPYTDTNNPFNDSSLTDVFVWNKKLETDGKTKLSQKEIEKMSRERIARNIAEMEELKRSRDARQSAKEDMEFIAREQEMRQHGDWRRTEDQFHLNQAKLRSKIRIKEGRAKSIDLLARYIAYGEENETNEEFELDDPLSYIKSCGIDDLEDLFADIKVYRVLDGRKHDKFWDDVNIIAQSEIKKIQRKRSENIHSTLHEEVLKIFKGKSYDQLEQLSTQIQGKISNAGRGTDVGYWETLMEELHPFMARQRLKETHSKKIQIRLKRIREEQKANMNEHEKQNPSIDDMKPSSSSITRPETKPDVHEMEFKMPEMPRGPITIPFDIAELETLDDEAKEQKWQLLDANQIEFVTLKMFAQGNYSPRYGGEDQAMPGLEILDEIDDERKLNELRAQYDTEGANLTAQESEMMAAAQQNMAKDENAFADEAELGQQTYLWSDKYRPRKPRYFNRVHTGFDWNKYNQTHYDIDNPPPKIVQGYRFNIFYPDLLESTQTPTFQVMECPDPDFAILKFKAGPPYEDIAFKIVNREWEINHKHGYKCQFQNGVLQLWFFFKRYRYRR
ncbi:conserved mid region of cactin domain-containing protein [Ditylenchus destructor]|nr:conserved mid region of cactin domain-containing protein [Ditylenchus destructor]